MADYYVSQSTGNDGWLGTIGQPWQTLAKISTEFAAATFGPDDQILFMRGDTWTLAVNGDRLRFTGSSGSVGKHIYLGAYSVGNRPIIAGIGATKISRGLFFRLVGDSAADYITVEELEFTNNHESGAIWIEDAHHWIFRDIYVHGITTTPGVWSGGIVLQQNMKYVWIEDSTITDIAGEGIYCGLGGDLTDRTRRVTIRDCDITYCDGEGIELKGGTSSCFIHDNYLTMNGIGGANFDRNQISIGGRYHVVYQCTIEGTRENGREAIYMGRYTTGNTYSGKYNRVERCLIKDATGSRGAFSLYGEYNEIVNCTIVDCEMGIYGFSGVGGGHVVRNNIFDNIAGYPVYLTNDENLYDFDNDDYSDGSVNVWYEAAAARNFAYVQGLGQEAAGITTGADFAELVTYTLNVTSPCIDAGNIAATVYDWNDEYTPVNSIDIGWREYGWTSWMKPYRTFKSFFEDALFGRFTGYAGVSLSSTPAPPEGTYSMEVDITDTADRYAYRTGLGYLKHFYANFYIHVDNLTMANGDQFDVFQGRTAGNVAIVVAQIYYSGVTIQIRAGLRNDASAWNYTSYFDLSAGWNLVEIFWRAAPDTTDDEGEIALWLDEVEMAHSDGFDNHDDTVDKFYVGAVFGLDVGTSGQMYIE